MNHLVQISQHLKNYLNPKTLSNSITTKSKPIIQNHQTRNFTLSFSNSTYEDKEKYFQEYAAYAKQHLSQEKNSDYNELEYVSSQFSHFDNSTQKPKQVDISEKKSNNSIRIACASGYIQLNASTFKALTNNQLKKGNALTVSEIAGIQASKQTANLIPLCHQIILDVCDVKFECDEETSRVRCETTCKTSVSKTGVEMEALTACSVALLTVYDMCKAVQKDAFISEIRLEYKKGGKSDFKRTN